MKLKSKDLWITIILIAIGILATAVFRINYSSRSGNEKLEKMPISEFTMLVNSNEPRVWFYMYNRHEIKYAGLQEDDIVERIYIAQKDKAYIYKDTNFNPTRLTDFDGLSPAAIVQRIENNMIPGHNYEKQPEEYDFSALPTSSNEGVMISIKPTNGLKNSNTFVQTISASEIVTDLRLDALTFAGYYHQASSADRFIKYQTQGLITPVEIEIKNDYSKKRESD